MFYDMIHILFTEMNISVWIFLSIFHSLWHLTRESMVTLDTFCNNLTFVWPRTFVCCVMVSEEEICQLIKLQITEMSERERESCQPQFKIKFLKLVGVYQVLYFPGGKMISRLFRMLANRRGGIKRK